MKNQKIAKLIALATAATMMLAPATAFAADVTDTAGASGSIAGEGQLEGYVNKDAFRVVLPTVTDVNFTLDPQGLLNKSDSTKYALGAGAVYFTNAATVSGNSATYSAKSDEIKFLNKSSYDVDVELSVTLDTGDIALVAKDAVATVSSPSLNLQLIPVDTDGTEGTAVDITDTAYTVPTPATVAKVAEVDGSTVTKGYTISSSNAPVEGAVKSPNGYYYTYSLTDDFTDADAKGVGYKLTGSCDTKTDWSKIDKTSVNATIAWTIAKSGAPSISGTAYNRQNTANTYTLKNFTGKTIKSIDVSVDGKTSAGTLPATGVYSVDDADAPTTLTINGTKVTLIGTGGVGRVRYFIVTLNDDSKVTFAVKVTDTAVTP